VFPSVNGKNLIVDKLNSNFFLSFSGSLTLTTIWVRIERKTDSKGRSGTLLSNTDENLGLNHWS
jgi:hypothetical protein